MLRLSAYVFFLIYIDCQAQKQALHMQAKATSMMEQSRAEAAAIALELQVMRAFQM